MDEGDGVRHIEGGVAVPACPVENHDPMGIGFEGRDELVEEELHGGGVGDGQDEGEGVAGIGSDGSEEVGSLVSAVLPSGWALATLPPKMAQPPLPFWPTLMSSWK